MSKWVQLWPGVYASEAAIQYIGYAVKDSDDVVTEAFAARFGRKPKEIKRTGGGVLAGPVEKEEVDETRRYGQAVEKLSR